MKFFFLTAFILFALSCSLIAQPEHQHIACHHGQQAALIPFKEATEEELLMMENSNKRSDSFDIINYSIHLDVSNVAAKSIQAFTEVEFTTRLPNLQSISFDLKNLSVDSIVFEGLKLNFNYDSNIIISNFGKSLTQNTTYKIEVYYHGVPSRDPVWGGLYFVDKYIYNLGIGLSTTPPNFGKVWFPCFDNFVERTTYDYYIKSETPTRAYCVGHLVSEDSTAKTIERHYRMDFPIPTYLSSFAVSDYVLDRSLTQSLSNPSLPIDLIARPSDIVKMKMQLAGIPDAVDAFEFWFGPYKFERVGFVATTVGAMEHPTNTAYPISSVTAGTLTDNERLMAHEFGHQWWGNLTTLDDARDMWIKEGNAEYASHLYFEHVYGVDRFQDVVKANLSFILFNAHINDKDYLPLSPMPYATTYGTHTYRKGAAMIHNLRAYLGDSLYKSICHTIFDSLTGKSMNAFEFRDFINRNSTVQVTDYFNDHIFNKGYLGFYIDSIKMSPAQINQFQLNIIQKVHHADHIGKNVPLQVIAYDKNRNRLVREVKVSEASNWVTVTFPLTFQPVIFMLNEDQTLNYASLQDKTLVKSTGNLPLAGSGMTPAVSEISDTAYINIAHHLVGPSEGRKKSNVLKLSDTHFWQVYALPKGKLKMSGRVDYNGNNTMSLDYELLRGGEDSVILVYRKDFTEEWRSYQPVTKLKVTPNDGRGLIRIDELIPGEYALAYGYNPVVHTNDLNDIAIKTYPNPVNDKLIIEKSDNDDVHEVQILNELGQVLHHQELEDFKTEISMSHFVPSRYSAVFFGKNGRFYMEKPFVIQR